MESLSKIKDSFIGGPVVKILAFLNLEIVGFDVTELSLVPSFF
jgi:hypothetical protein